MDSGSDSGEFSEHYEASISSAVDIRGWEETSEEEHYKASIRQPTSNSGSEETGQEEDDIPPQKIQKSRDKARKAAFKERAKDAYDIEDSIFDRPGLKFLRCRHDKIKFTFTPSDVAATSERYIFYCTLRYRKSYSYWFLMRDTFPADCKAPVNRLLFTKYKHSRADDDIFNIISDLYQLLVNWSRKEAKFRKWRYSKFLRGDDIQLDSIEEEMFLTHEEIREIHKERDRILKRMIPPNYVE